MIIKSHKVLFMLRGIHHPSIGGNTKEVVKSKVGRTGVKNNREGLSISDQSSRLAGYTLVHGRCDDKDNNGVADVRQDATHLSRPRRCLFHQNLRLCLYKVCIYIILTYGSETLKYDEVSITGVEWGECWDDARHNWEDSTTVSLEEVEV